MCAERQSKIDDLLFELRSIKWELVCINANACREKAATTQGCDEQRQKIATIQLTLGLPPDGIIGPSTRRALRALGV